ncbi:MAG TPA: formylglycine-generating enzyme family protein, partial [Candidatus Hydrogenedentes bacterium]|nr:formylglycine-generating enzyme family protein [Candidatus Hydrogenedentota bacterium]
QAFITAVNAHITTTGQGPATLRLPSEAEWEYACRGGTQTRFYFGDSLGVGDSCEDDGERSQYMWYCGNNADYGSKPVGGKMPNGFGLHDMSGNVYEWCEDWWHSDYTGAPADGSAWVSPTASYRVLRGGNWGYNARSCRSANRHCYYPSYRYSSMGFRLASVR